MRVFFAQSQRELVNSAAHASGCSTTVDNAHFWLEVGMATQEICAISGQSSWLLPRFALILGWIAYCWENLCKSCWEGWLAGLYNHGAQQVVREDCAIPWGKAVFPPEMCNFQGEAAQPVVEPSLGEQPVRGMDQLWSIGCHCARKTHEASTWRSKTKCFVRLVGRLQNRPRKKFGGWL